MIVVSDTSPICYLLLINRIDILQTLYSVVIIPQAVANELSDSEAPSVVKNWIAQPPSWLQIQSTETLQSTELRILDPGEREAILLAEQLNADLVDLLGNKTSFETGCFHSSSNLCCIQIEVPQACCI